MKFAWSKNKKGAALVYAIMVLLLLSTVIVALTALSTSSYTDAVLAVSDDQSYYYAKSIGLAVKEQFKDGYNISRIITELDRQEAILAEKGEDSPYQDPKVTGTFTIAKDTGDLVSGTVQIRYKRDGDGNVDKNTIEVRSACVINNSPAAVTSIFTCEDLSGEEVDVLKKSFTDYDVILTDTNKLSFDFSESSTAANTSNLNVYVYAGEDDTVQNPDFDLCVDMGGSLTTTGKTKIKSKLSVGGADVYHRITGNFVAYGDLELYNTGVYGSKGVHCDGNVVLHANSYVMNDIYARGTVNIEATGALLNLGYYHSGGYVMQGPAVDTGYSGNPEFVSAKNIYAHGNVTIGAQARIKENVYTHGDVTVTGKQIAPEGPDWGNNAYSTHYGNTVIQGSVYSEGNVIIQRGAVVVGNVYANGNVTVREGACVVGNVQSLNGNVYVHSAVIGGQVNCPKGTIELDNSKFPSASAFVAEADFGGTMVFGGIGCFQSGTVFKHTCNTLKTADVDNVSVAWGNMYVSNPTTDSGYTPLLSVWIYGSLYLENSIASFANTAGGRYYEGKNSAGNPYTYVVELNQKQDLYDKTGLYANMFGAHVVTMNVGDKQSALYDAYLWNGWIKYVNARCLYLADIMVDDYALIYAAQYLEVWGTKSQTGWRDYSKIANYTRGFSAPYTYAQSGTEATTVIPVTARIDVACKMPSYSGVFGSTVSCGFYQGINSTIYAAPVEGWGSGVYIGADASDPTDSYVILGDESQKGPTRFYGVMHAYVGNFKITASTRLSDAKSGSWSYAGLILAEVTGGGNPNYDNDGVRLDAAKNSFYVEKSTSNGEYRYGSYIQVKGNAYVAGYVYNFDHFVRDDGSGKFTNADSARIKGAFRSTGDLEIKGTNCFSEIQATNSDSTTTLKGSLTVDALRLNGSFKMESASHTLTVNGDMYVAKMASQIVSSVKVTGNLTINSSTIDLAPQKTFKVGGDLYLGSKNLTLSGSSQVVTGRVQFNGGREARVTVQNNAKIGGAWSYGELIIDGGELTGNFDVGYLTVRSGTVAKENAQIYGSIDNVFTHIGGSINRAYITVQGSADQAVVIRGDSSSNKATARSVFIYAKNGGASVTGGSNVDYSGGGLITKKSATVAGGFKCGIAVKEGNLTIGSTTTTTDRYIVGCAYYPHTNYDVEPPKVITNDDAYRVIYASGNITWGYGARTIATAEEKGTHGGWTHLTAGGNVTMGKSDYYVEGRFDQICAGGNVKLYVDRVYAVTATGSSTVDAEIYFTGFIGAVKDDDEAGVRLENGNLHLYPKTGKAGSTGEYLRGHVQIDKGYLYIENKLNVEGCRIMCKDIYTSSTSTCGLENIHNDASGYKPVSLYLTSPATESDGYYRLNYSIAGAFSINTNLKYNSPVTVRGELYVKGKLKYNDSLENLECNGGLYCENDKVNVTSAFKGNVHLPFVTELKLNADIGVNAPKVTTLDLNIDITHSLNLSSCTQFTVASGRTVSGSIIIKNTGKIINNGTIGESVDCGVYEGSGTVGGNLVTRTSGGDNKITTSGDKSKIAVGGSIWTNGNLTINTYCTIGKQNSYIYADGNITIDNASFYYTNDNNCMDYILSTGGDIKLTNCVGRVPKVWNMKGAIVFVNDSEAKRATIREVVSYGTYVWLGTKDGNNYQTVTGDLEWHGTYEAGTISGKNYAIDFWGGAGRTVINGSIRAYGTGNVHTSAALIKSVSHFRNKGSVNSSAGGVYEKNVWINTSTSTNVTSVSMNASIQGDLVIYGKSTTTITLGGTMGASSSNFIHVHTAKSLTINGVVKGSVNAASVETINLNKAVAGSFTCSNGKLTTKADEGTIGGNLRAYDEELHVNANVGGAVTHTAHAISASYPIKTVALGNQNKTITVGGNITVHGRLVDNSKQTKSSAVINCLGTYYADLMKDFTNCSKLNFTTEADGPCVIVGAKDKNKDVNPEINVNGRLGVYSVWNEEKNTDYKINFRSVVRASALIVNCKPAEALGYSDGLLKAAPETKVIRYTKSTSNDAKGLDKRACMENLETCAEKGKYNASWVDIYYNARTDKSTGQDIIVFNKPVYITISNPSKYASLGYRGTVHAANCKFASGSTLYSDGQTCMKYCCLYSKGWKSSTEHCTSTTPNNQYVSFLVQGNPVFDFDGSMFVHCYNEGGDNYFSHVTTNSNIGIYYGDNYILDESEFKGCTVTNTKTNKYVSNYYMGHTATVLMYFAKNTFFDGGAHVLSAADLDVDIPAARTIIWVATGTLFVGTNSYIGNNSRKDRSPNYANLNTNRYSFHPGIFVSQQTSSGSISYKAANGTTYNCEYGSIEVVGSVTLDIMAYRAINIWKGGVVVAKEYSSTKDKKYKAGLYCSTGYVWLQQSGGSWQKNESNPSGGGWFGLFDATSGGRNYHVKNDNSQVTVATAYQPNGEGYAAQLRRRYSATADANAWCYTPWPDVPWAFYGSREDRYPTGVGSTNMTTTSGISASDSLGQVSEIGEKSAPSMPSITAAGDFGDASVNPLVVKNVTQPDSFWNFIPATKQCNAITASAADSSIVFYGGKASNNTLYWTSPNYTVSGITMIHPSAKWTSDISKHFDKTNTSYWNTRFIPFVWKLPYEGTPTEGKTGNTPAKRLLEASDSKEVNGHMMLKQTSSTGYYTNESMYAGSSLANKAGSLLGWRSAGGSKLNDFVVINGYPEWDGPFDKDPDHKRRTKILVFESGELPYSAFFMGEGTASEDYASWNNWSGKKIRGVNQKAWKLGDPDVSFYDGSLVFYTCADPANPYSSAAKDLHVVLPQGIGFDFVVDAENTVTVVGRGRVFLYLTSGDTVIFRAKATDGVYANPVGGLKSNGDGTYSPLLYIIGAGTNIDLYIDRMPVGAFIYMPFGSDERLYDASNGTYKAYNIFKNVNGSTFYNKYNGTGATTSIGSNTLHLLWDGTSGGARNMWGTFVVDKFDYQAASDVLNFRNYSGGKRVIVPDLSKTKIYARSTKNNNTTKLGDYKEYSLATFLDNAPDQSTKFLNWEYVGIKVEG